LFLAGIMSQKRRLGGQTLAPRLSPSSERERAPLRRKVVEIREVELVALGDGALEVRACGTVPALGWSAPELIPHTHVAPPRDGIYDVDFVAEAPERGSPSVIDVLIAEVRLPLPRTAKGVRVHGSTNAMVAIAAEARRG